jgi:peptidoglycan/LPS O-acetylase OafA/YrhL
MFPPPDRIKELDALRGFAAISVVLFHYTMACPPLERYFVFGVTGVELFFMISGFVIFFTLQHTKTGLDFIVSRFSRLYPTYWVCVTLTLLFILCQGRIDGRFMEDLGYMYGMNLTMWQQYFQVEDLEWTYWTLTVEWQFYAFMYLLFVAKKLQQVEHVGWLGLGLSLCFGTFVPLNFTNLYQFLKTYLPLIEFFPLFLAGVLFYKLKFESPRVGVIGQLLACLATQFLLFEYAGTSSWHLSPQNYAIALIGFFAVFTLLAYGYLSFIVNKVTVYLGAISYPLYLIHLYFGYSFFTPFLIRHFSISYAVASLCITLPLVLMLSSFLHQKVEVPSTLVIRQWYNRYKSLK